MDPRQRRPDGPRGHRHPEQQGQKAPVPLPDGHELPHRQNNPGDGADPHPRRPQPPPQEPLFELPLLLLQLGQLPHGGRVGLRVHPRLAEQPLEHLLGVLRERLPEPVPVLRQRLEDVFNHLSATREIWMLWKLWKN